MGPLAPGMLVLMGPGIIIMYRCIVWVYDLCDEQGNVITTEINIRYTVYTRCH